MHKLEKTKSQTSPMTENYLILTIFVVVVAVYYAIYFSATIVKSTFWGDILSPIGGILAIGIMVNAIFRSKGHQKIQVLWLLMALGVLCWVLGDIFWAVMELGQGQNPIYEENINLFYFGTNIFFAITITIYCITTFRKWNNLQLLIDTGAILINVAYIFWCLFLDRSNSLNDIVVSTGWISTIAIILDILIIAGISVWVLSIRDGKIPFFFFILSVGMLVFSITDLIYFYQLFRNLYEANTIIDAVYMGSFLILALAAVWMNYGTSKNSIGADLKTVNIGSKHRGFLFAAGFFVVTFVKGFRLDDFISFSLFILAYETFSTVVQINIRNADLLKKERELTSLLEQKITERTKELQAANTELNAKNDILDFLSNQDTVTRLYNRRFFIRSLEKKIEAISENTTIVLFFIDLDRFKTINDTYGHATGDRVLIEISRRLERWSLENTLLARLGGDEFVLAVQGTMGYDEAVEYARKVVNACSQSIEINEYAFQVTMSVGISIYPLDAMDCATLMKNADIAMYQAKANGYNLCVPYNSTLLQTISRKNEIEIQMRKIDPDREFTLHYQPQFRLPENELIGVEALLRWNSPEIGKVSPAEFIPIAEETDAIIPIGKWVIEEAVEQIIDWRKKYSLPGKVGINVSPKQLDNRHFIQELKSIIQEKQINPDWLDIEITEGVAIEGEFRVKEIAGLFAGMGVSISIDDFGTGYSSLSMLRSFPFDRIKIAKPLVDAICTEKYDQQIVKSIIQLAKAIGIKTIAEGVETQEQYDILVDLGCEEVQGYLLGKPMGAREFEERFLKTEQESEQKKALEFETNAANSAS